MTGATKAKRKVGRPPGPAPDHEQRRQELLEAATRVIRREGADASMDQLAAEARLTKPILYTYFRDKAGLADALGEQVAIDLGNTLMSALATVSDARDVVRVTIESWVTFVDTEPNLYAFLVQGAAGTGRGFARQRLIVNVGTSLALVIGAGLNRAGHDVRQAEPLAFAILGAVLFACEWWQGQTDTVSRDELVDQLTDFVWAGVGGAGLNEMEGPLVAPWFAQMLASNQNE